MLLTCGVPQGSVFGPTLWKPQLRQRFKNSSTKYGKTNRISRRHWNPSGGKRHKEPVRYCKQSPGNVTQWLRSNKKLRW